MCRLTLLALLALGACTPQQHQAWLDWFETNPRAAVRFVKQGCGGLGCTVDWGDTTTGGDIWNEPEPDTGIYWPWDALAECESGGDWHIATGNGYYGGLQFAFGSWQAVGGTGYPHEHSPAEQIHRAELLQDAQGWGAWPTCARIIGLL